MGRPLPGYTVALIDPATGERGTEGEICLDLSDRPLGLMVGYHGEPDRAADVFKASDYRISPFELESVLLEHESVAEAAVVPSPDPVRLAVPKAYVVLAAGYQPDRDTAAAIFAHSRDHLAG